MNSMVDYVAARAYPQLERRKGGGALEKMLPPFKAGVGGPWGRW